jgi:hypothetical protein
LGEEDRMGAVPNLFDSVIARILDSGSPSAENIAAALASSEFFLRAINNGLQDARQKGVGDSDTVAGFVRSALGKAFSASTANQMF